MPESRRQWQAKRHVGSCGGIRTGRGRCWDGRRCHSPAHISPTDDDRCRCRSPTCGACRPCRDRAKAPQVAGEVRQRGNAVGTACEGDAGEMAGVVRPAPLQQIAAITFEALLAAALPGDEHAGEDAGVQGGERGGQVMLAPARVHLPHRLDMHEARQQEPRRKMKAAGDLRKAEADGFLRCCRGDAAEGKSQRARTPRRDLQITLPHASPARSAKGCGGTSPHRSGPARPGRTAHPHRGGRAPVPRPPAPTAPASRGWPCSRRRRR